ncbi:hypothetical protein QBC34DRAFT_455729, partial [Podospora aff. communis PSN243]
IFVGKFWDVVLQTKNCFSILERLTPVRGIWLLWVDAICINQEDLVERESQVANMLRIYSACSRVVVYPGADMVRRPLGGQFAPRHDLDDFDDVMENEGAIFLVGEFLANATSLARLSVRSGWVWAKTAAPWLRHLGSQALNQDSQNFLDALLVTARSESSDVRDKVFGILGLLGDQELRPNYSASATLTFLGAFLHQLLVQQDLDTLILEDGPDEEIDGQVLAPNWPEMFIEHMKIDGGTYRITLA